MSINIKPETLAAAKEKLASGPNSIAVGVANHLIKAGHAEKAEGKGTGRGYMLIHLTHEGRASV